MSAINKNDGIPFYIKIQKAILEDIRNGTLSPEQKMLSEGELALFYGVSRMTIRQGISNLVDEGILYRRHGIGTFVAHQIIERDHSKLTNFMESAKKDGFHASIKLLSADVIKPKIHIAQALLISEKDYVIRIKTLRYLENIPITVHTAFVPYKFIPELVNENFENNHLWDLFEKFGFKVKRAVQLLKAIKADEELAELLNVDIGSAILFKERTVFLDSGIPFEFNYCFNRGDRYTLKVILDR